MYKTIRDEQYLQQHVIRGWWQRHLQLQVSPGLAPSVGCDEKWGELDFPSTACLSGKGAIITGSGVSGSTFSRSSFALLAAFPGSRARRYHPKVFLISPDSTPCESCPLQQDNQNAKAMPLGNLVPSVRAPTQELKQYP